MLNPAAPVVLPGTDVAADVTVAAKAGIPVMLLGPTLEIPPEPVIENDVGIGAPLTPGAAPYPTDIAPGNGVISMYPLVVSTIVPRLATTGMTR
jgi:hypothetical protein